MSCKLINICFYLKNYCFMSKINKKLFLNKETVVILNAEQMKTVVGGIETGIDGGSGSLPTVLCTYDCTGAVCNYSSPADGCSGTCPYDDSGEAVCPESNAKNTCAPAGSKYVPHYTYGYGC